MTPVRVFVQARMSSRRFPGKVLAPFRGHPIIDHVVAAAQAGTDAPIVVVTSVETSDDPLATHLAARGVPCFRGPLDDVMGRFLAASAAFPCEHALRVCADSPLLSPSVVRAVVGQAAGRRDPVDLVSTTLTRTLPKGLNVELVRIATLRRLHETASATQREHVTAALHEIRNELRVISMELEGPPLSHVDLCVDTVDDLHRLEATSTAALAAYVDLVPVPR